jgi:RNA polymerase sigma-70 factor (ECF subfamily)
LSDFQQALAAHRPDLLRHCYRMLGSFADAEDVVQDVLLSAWNARDSYSGIVPLAHWLLRISTNACLNELARRRRRGLPQTAREAATTVDQIELLEAADWLTPAPDSRLFAPPAQANAARESVALAFLALLQQLPPRQRAVLLLKDVVGWSAEEIATALDMTLGARAPTGSSPSRSTSMRTTATAATRASSSSSSSTRSPRPSTSSVPTTCAASTCPRISPRHGDGAPRFGARPLRGMK